MNRLVSGASKGALAAILTLILVLPVAAVAAEPLPLPEARSMTLFHYQNTITTSEMPPLNNLYYELLGLELKSTYTYFVNPRGSGIDSAAVTNQVQLSFNAWNATTDFPLFNYGGSTGKEYSRDGQNTVSWAKLDSNAKVAMITIWYVPDTDGDGLDEIVEADLVFNSRLKWGIDPDGEGPKTINKYDLGSVATHEAGHIVGLAGLTDGSCRELTMCEYSAIGQTNKMSLEGGDVAGAQAIYGVRYSR